MINPETLSSKRTQPRINILNREARENEAIKSHGCASEKSKSPIRLTKTNVSKAAMQAALGSFGVIPGPIEGVTLNHPDRGLTRSSKKR